MIDRRPVTKTFTPLHYTSHHYSSLHYTCRHFTFYQLKFTQIHFTSLHYTCRHFTSFHLNFTQLQFTTLLFELTPFKFPTAPFHLTQFCCQLGFLCQDTWCHAIVYVNAIMYVILRHFADLLNFSYGHRELNTRCSQFVTLSRSVTPPCSLVTFA
jgi:hypothetical protein